MEAYLEALIALAPKLIAAGMDIVPLVQKLVAMWNNSADPTDQDWADLAALEAPLRDQLQKPIPADPDGSTET